jgi:hypothetical protein
MKVQTQVVLLFFLLLVTASAAAEAKSILSDDFSGGLGGWKTGERVEVDRRGGRDGFAAVKIHYNGPGTREHVLSRPIPGNHQELYIRFDFKVEGFPTGGAKFLKVRAIADDQNYANTTWAIDQNSGSLREISFGAGHLVNDTQETIRYNGEMRGRPGPVQVLHAGGVYAIPQGVWQNFEVHLRLNSDGLRDGLYRVWINDRLVLHAENIVNRHDRNPRHINRLLLGNYCQKSWKSPWALFYDNVQVSTAPIGKGARSAGGQER